MPRAVVLIALLLSGCAHDFTNAGCPNLKAYNRETLNGVSLELSKLGPDSPTRQLVKDYGALRAACRTK